MRIVFAGTPDFAATSLAALLPSTANSSVSSDVEVVAVYTQPDRPAGRGRKLKPSPVKALAEAHHLPVYQPISLKTPEAQAELAALKPDLMIVVAYGLILPKAVLEIPRLGCINVHASLLPRWRGAAPIQRALIEGDTETGVTLMQMDEGLDTGDMLLKTHCPITATDTSATLHDKLATQGGEALQALLPQLIQGTLTPTPQVADQATYAAKLSKPEAQLNWRQSATVLDRAIRGYQPWPVAWTQQGDDVIRVWAAQPLAIEHNAEPGLLLDVEKDGLIVACDSGCLKLTQLQLPNAKQMPVTALLNGHPDRFIPGETRFALPPASDEAQP